MRPTLLDQLYYNIDIESKKAEAPSHPPATPAQHTPEVQQAASRDMSNMKFTHSLIKHLDQVYSKMLAGEVSQIASEPQYNAKQKIIEGQTDSLILNEKEAYYNQGNSAVTESM
jgi:hypothetical protein